MQYMFSISIHAPRVGCDLTGNGSRISPGDFNPRTPCGVRQEGIVMIITALLFQSTHPVWGATAVTDMLGDLRNVFQSTHPVWGATRSMPSMASSSDLFQSTHPVWGATFSRSGDGARPAYFNPRTPCGVRPFRTGRCNTCFLFQSTHPVWGATSRRASRSDDTPIFQSTHPVWGATVKRFSIHSRNHNFNPRTPCGVRLCSTSRTTMATPISIHAPRVGCDRTRPPRDWEDCYFNPRTPCGVRL